MEKKNLHKDHRQRVRARYLSEGIGSMAEHNIVELLLFFGIPYKDTNDIAHALIERFGDLNGVLDAPVEELMKTDGIGENTATLIRLTRDIAVRYFEKKNLDRMSAGDGERVTDFIELKYTGETREIVYMLTLDSHGGVQRCVKVCEGSPDSATVDNREVVETALRFDTKNIILAHNHPNGFAVPSVADVKATEQLVQIFDSIGINLADHIIVSADDTFSMARSNKYGSLFR
ncbi:MAG: RadC family protein [Clostridia bacterium]|nr:RadC family protein [Clostridia bacterium]